MQDRLPPPRTRAYFARNVTLGEACRREPLFYLHGDVYGGGLYCLSLGSHLGVDQPLYALNPHGMGGTEVPPSVEAMAAAHVETVTGLMPGISYRLAGHCNGGLIAYEMARQLVARGARVDRLILIAARADYGKVTALSRVRARCAHRVRRWWSLEPPQRSSEMLRVVRVVAARMLRAIAPWCARYLPAPPPIRRSVVLDAYRPIMAAYQPGPYAGAVTLLWPAEEPNPRPKDPTMGWSRVAPGVQVQIVPGDHESCLRTHVQALATVMRRCLDDGPTA